jgi:hypothetical protein
MTRGSPSRSTPSTAALAVTNLRVGLAASGPARPVEEDPHRGLSGFDLWIVAVLQYLDPGDHAFGEGLPDLLLDAIGQCPVHAILRWWPVVPNGNARIRRRRSTFRPARLHVSLLVRSGHGPRSDLLRVGQSC